MEPNLKDSMKKLVSEAHQFIQTKKMDLYALSKANHILVLHSTDIQILRQFFPLLRQLNPQAFLFIITHARGGEIETICDSQCKIIEYKPEEIIHLKDQAEEFVVLYNTKYGMDNYDIDELIGLVINKHFYTFNNEGEFARIEKPNLYAQSKKLLKVLSDWHWAYLGEGK